MCIHTQWKHYQIQVAYLFSSAFDNQKDDYESEFKNIKKKQMNKMKYRDPGKSESNKI